MKIAGGKNITEQRSTSGLYIFGHRLHRSKATLSKFHFNFDCVPNSQDWALWCERMNPQQSVSSSSSYSASKPASSYCAWEGKFMTVMVLKALPPVWVTQLQFWPSASISSRGCAPLGSKPEDGRSVSFPFPQYSGSLPIK